jgi:hypothetical protein
VPRKTDSNLPVVDYFPSATERVVRPGHIRWRKGEHLRVLVVEPDRPPGVVAVLVAHRDFPLLGFRLDLSAVGDLVGFAVRPLVEVEEGPVTSYDVDAVAYPDDAPAITSRRVRELPVGALHLAAQAAARQAGRLLGATVDAPDWPAVFRAERRPGRRGRPDVFYAGLSAEYVGLLDTTRPVATMAERRGISASQVRNLLAEARRRDLLTHPGQGRARGALTDRAVALLRKTNNTEQRED